MTYPACLPSLMRAWGMTAVEAGTVQSVFLVSFTTSLLANSWAADHFGAKRVYLLYAWFAAITAIVFALFARSFETALVLVVFAGFAQGGANTPAIMLVSQNVPEDRRGTMVGWLLAGTSAGYAISIALSVALNFAHGYEVAFIVCASMTIIGSICAWLGTRDWENRVFQTKGADRPSFSLLRNRRALVLTTGFVGHSWELVGAWSWVPAFLSLKLASTPDLIGVALGGAGLGIAIGFALHVSGFCAATIMGRASDRYGKRCILILGAAMGAAGSLCFGWIGDWSAPALLFAAAIYGFAITGDGAVLSAAVTESVPPSHLGRALGLRTGLGLGLAALAPTVFGIVLEVAPSGSQWGWAFIVLAGGGILATFAAIMLPSDRTHEVNGSA